jgi:hypothetical protein
MVSVIALVVVVAVAAMVVVSQRQSVLNMKKLLRDAQEKSIELEEKISSSRNELRKSKEDLEREKNSLRDARELAKKKLRRQANEEVMQQQSGAAMINNAIDDSHKAIRALEAQIEQLKKEQGQSEEAVRARMLEEFKKEGDEQANQIESFKKKISELEADLKKQRRLMRPEGNKIDLKTLPDEAAGEFARVYRKAEQHERLHGIARAKLHLAQEKFTELQKRYFSVCRELAVLAGNKSDIEAKEARDIAENITEKPEGQEAPKA